MNDFCHFLQNSVSETSSIQANESYPAAIDEDDDLANASNVENHLSGHDETLNETVQQNELCNTNYIFEFYF